jgi:hypothetical protein
VADVLNQWALIPLRREIKHGVWNAIIGHQGHDSLTVSVLPEDAWDIADFLRRSLERPREYFDGERKHQLVIPATFKLGSNWGEMKEFKALPSRRDFEELAHSLLEEKIPCSMPSEQESQWRRAEVKSSV